MLNFTKGKNKRKVEHKQNHTPNTLTYFDGTELRNLKNLDLSMGLNNYQEVQKQKPKQKIKDK